MVDWTFSDPISTLTQQWARMLGAHCWVRASAKRAGISQTPCVTPGILGIQGIIENAPEIRLGEQFHEAYNS